MSEASSEAALPFLGWSRIWSPVVPDDLRTEAWQALNLSDSFSQHSVNYWSTFHTGMPVPKVPLLLHAALNRDGTGVREDWLRVMSHLGLEWEDMHLPPDQLGICCEIYACTIERNEQVLIKELDERYFQPWCEFASNILQQESNPLIFVIEAFTQSLKIVNGLRGS